VRLRAVRLANFRSLRDTDWIKISDLIAFIGENDGGKTACTDAIKLLLDRTARPDEADFSWEKITGEESHCRAESIVIEAKLSVQEKDEDKVREVLGAAAAELHIKRTFVLNGGSSLAMIGEVPAHEDFRGNWEENTVPQLRKLANEHSIDISGASLKADIVAKIRDWLQDEPTVEGERELPNGFFDLLPRVEIFSSSQAVDPEQIINDALRLLCKQEIASDRYRGEIKAIEQGITESLRQKLQELTPFVRKYYSEIEEARIDPVFNIQSGLVPVPLKLSKAGGGPIELKKKGEGKRRQVALGIYEWTTELLKDGVEEDVLLVLDEPDTHLDYHSQRKLFDIIQGYVETDMQVIICTHSLNLINRMPVEKIHHFRLDSEGWTEIENMSTAGDEEEARFINEIGLSLGLDTGTVFHERCFFVVEGQTEMHALPEIFRLLFDESLQSAGIKLVNGEGNAGARHFAKFLKDNGRNVVFLLDSDCRNDGSRNRIFSASSLLEDGFLVGKDVFFVGEVEFEDAFDDAVIATLANRYHPREEEGPWCSEEFSSMRGGDTKLSNLLQRLFQCSKPQIGHELGQTIRDKGHVPDQIVTALARAYDLANS
jgi:predicted ATP-dependent endonuclease of OLD family